MADAFPLIEGDEFDALVANIGELGLREPIVLDHTRTILIDGRNRYRACDIATIDPVYRYLGPQYTEKMIIDFILSANIRRRHLNPSQLALIALEAERLCAATTTLGPVSSHRPSSHESPAGLPGSRSTEENQARSQAARQVGVSPRLVQTAKAVMRDAPDLHSSIQSGALSLEAADRERKDRLSRQPKPKPATPASSPKLVLHTHTGEEVAYQQSKGKAKFNQTQGEGISWAQWSWNPVTGCLHGCDYCYAREFATSARLASVFPAAFTPLFHPERLDAPANTTVPTAQHLNPSWRRVFVCSMADLYGRWVPDEWINQIHTAMLTSPDWEYLLLTKFPSRYTGLKLPPSAWVGTSVDEQKRVRIAEDAFANIHDVKVKWLSLEPLKEPLIFNDLSMFNWIVIGAQTQTRQPHGIVPAVAPPFEWVARLVAQAREAGCRVHLKPNLLGQTNPQSPGMVLPDEYPV